MANEYKEIAMPAIWGSWRGLLQVSLDHDANNEKATVKATMTVYEMDGGSPKEGLYRFYLQITKDGQRLTYAGNEGWQIDMYLTDWSSGGYKLYCETSFSYNESCSVGVNGWAICDAGVLGGSYLDGSLGWKLEAYHPPTPIVTNVDTIQMKKKLSISLRRAYDTYTHKLTYRFGTGKETELAANVGTSYTWDVPDMANLCNDATSGECTLRAVTYDGNKTIGETTKVITITVPDPTTPSIVNGEVTMGTGSTIVCQRNSSNFTVKLQFEFYNLTSDIAEDKIDTYTWKPGYDLAKQIPALTYGTGTLHCITLNGTAEVGRKKATIKAFVPENNTTRPIFTLSGLELTPISDLGEAFAGRYLFGKTGLEAKISASSEYSALQDYSITVGTLSAAGNPARIPILVDEGDVKVTAKVTDARGYSTVVVTTIQVLPYRRPKVIPYTGYNDIVCERALASGELSPQGTFLALKAGKSFSSVNLDGKEMNPCVLRYRWKLSDSGGFGSWNTLLDKESAETEVSLLISDVCTSLTSSYVVELSVEDSLGGSHSVSFVIMTEAVSFTLYPGDDGAAFGKYPEAPHVVDVASHMTLRVRGNLVVDNTNWNNLGFASGITESVYAYGRKEDSGCHYLVDAGSHVFVAFNCGFSYSGTAMVINSTPIPAEHRPARIVMSLCPANEMGIALVSVSSDGYIRVEWVQKMTDTVQTGTLQVIWIDGYLDYWI